MKTTLKIKNKIKKTLPPTRNLNKSTHFNVIKMEDFNIISVKKLK